MLNVASNGHKKTTTKNTQKSFKTSKNASQKHVLHHYFQIPVYHFPEGKFSINETKTDITNISGSDHATQNNSNCIR